MKEQLIKGFKNKKVQKPKAKAPSKAADDWDSSDESDEEQTKATTKTSKSNSNSLDHSDESETEQPQESKSKTQSSSTSPDKENETDVFADAERIKKLQKKMQNYKKKQKKKKKRKKKPVQQQSVPSKNDKNDKKDNDSSSDSSDDDDKKPKNGKKMETYEERMRTDNQILFEGINQKKPKAEDNRAMLSGQVQLKNFPLGSGRDCENLASQVSALLDQKLFEDAINANDVFLFYRKLLNASIIEKLDMVDTKALTTKMNGILTAKQKAWHKKKNPSYVLACLFVSLHRLHNDLMVAGVHDT